MLKSFFVGLSRASQSGKMILLLVIANLLFSFPIVIPILLVVMVTSSGHLASEKLLADKIDVNWLIDLFNHQFAGASLESAAAEVGTLLIVIGVLYILLNTLFAGGILEIFHSEDGQFTMRKFWTGCGAWFWRFFRLMLLSFIFYGIAYGIFKLMTAPINSSEETASEYAPIFYQRWAASVVLVMLFAYINMVFDYAKIGAVVNNNRRMFQETFRALRFTLRRFFTVYGLYWLVTIAGLVLFVFFAWTRSLLPQRSGGAVLLAMLIGQMAIAGRVWTRLNFYASELYMFERLSPSRAAPERSQPIEFGPPARNPIDTDATEISSPRDNETEVVVQSEPDKL
jgi:hypothetical protein